MLGGLNGLADEKISLSPVKKTAPAVVAEAAEIIVKLSS